MVLGVIPVLKVAAQAIDESGVGIPVAIVIPWHVGSGVVAGIPPWGRQGGGRVRMACGGTVMSAVSTTSVTSPSMNRGGKLPSLSPP